MLSVYSHPYITLSALGRSHNPTLSDPVIVAYVFEDSAPILLTNVEYAGNTTSYSFDWNELIYIRHNNIASDEVWSCERTLSQEKSITKQYSPVYALTGYEIKFD